jgi:hypothetical protein
MCLVADGRSKSLLHTGTIFHVEARSRILFFDVGISAEVLSRHSASRVSLSHLSMLPPRHSSHDHDTSLQRPSQARHSSAPRLRGLRQGSRGEMRGEGASVLQAWASSSGLPTTAAEYAARAMRLSLFGSKVTFPCQVLYLNFVFVSLNLHIYCSLIDIM